MYKAETKKKLLELLKSTELHVDAVATVVEKRFIPQMVKDAEQYRLQLCDDYEVLKTPKVKEILMEDYNRLNKNIRTLKFVQNHHMDVIPVFERLGN